MCNWGRNNLPVSTMEMLLCLLIQLGVCCFHSEWKALELAELKLQPLMSCVVASGGQSQTNKPLPSFPLLSNPHPSSMSWTSLADWASIFFFFFPLPDLVLRGEHESACNPVFFYHHTNRAWIGQRESAATRKIWGKTFFFFCILGAETEIRNVKSKNAVGTSWTWNFQPSFHCVILSCWFAAVQV